MANTSVNSGNTTKITLWDEGGIIQFPLPQQTYRKDNLPFVKFERRVLNGFIKHYLHTTEDITKNQLIIAKVAIMLKELEDGKQYLFINLFRVPNKTMVTHELRIEKDDSASNIREQHGWITFKCPTPLSGSIAIRKKRAKKTVCGKSETTNRTAGNNSVLSRELGEQLLTSLP